MAAQEGKYFFSGNQLITSEKPARQGKIQRGKDGTPTRNKGFPQIPHHSSPVAVPRVLQEEGHLPKLQIRLNCRERAALRGHRYQGTGFSQKHLQP